MTAETIETTGVVKGNTIVLEDDVPLPEGARVALTVALEERSAEERREELYARLEAQGLISVPKTPPERIRETTPIEVKGKPLSEIIIEERR